MSVTEWDSGKLDRFSSVPLYQQLSDILTGKIEDGTLKPGDQLPSEYELRGKFEVSRHVVRQTLNTLSRQGIIFTEHGRGSYVARKRIDKPLGVLQSYHDSMRKSGLDPEVKILRKDLVVPPEQVASQLRLHKGEQAFYLERVGYLDGSPVSFLEAYIAPGNWGYEKLMQFPGGSLYTHLEQACGIRLAYCRFSIDVIFADEVESRVLNMPRGTVLIQLVSTTSDKEGTPVEHTRTLQPATMFRFHFDSYNSTGESDHVVIQ